MGKKKKPVDSLLSSLEEIKKQTSDPEPPRASPGPGPDLSALTRPSSPGADILGSLLSEVRKEADEEKARLDQTLAAREDERRRRQEEEEEERRAKYQKLVQEEAGRRQAQLRQKEDRARQAVLEEERRKQAEAEKVARAKALEELARRRRRQRVVNLAVAAVLLVGLGVALGVTRPWERTEPLKGIEESRGGTYVSRSSDFKPLYNAGDRGDPSFVEPPLQDEGARPESIPPIEALAWLMQGEMRSVSPDRSIQRADRILLADADVFRGDLQKRFAKMTWIEEGRRPGGSNSGGKPPGDGGLQLDLTAFGQKDKDKKKKNR
ncbi:MAG: hypothetical protein FJ098_08595 [Deltaproteobacteria bacterium]|nr:hypothetical protein [Deltaproteobacteria bacterium]